MESPNLWSQSNVLSDEQPLQQKRLLAFVNQFLISSCSFLNKFALNCEQEFLTFERKLQKVEASLTIIEAKLTSIPGAVENNRMQPSSKELGVNEKHAENAEKPINENNEPTKSVKDSPSVNGTMSPVATTGVHVINDERYSKFFKMLQFGVPADAVKIKMRTEGVDPQLLDNLDSIPID